MRVKRNAGRFLDYEINDHPMMMNKGLIFISQREFRIVVDENPSPEDLSRSRNDQEIPGCRGVSANSYQLRNESCGQIAV